MGYSAIPALGSKYGPCKGECVHRDCLATRRDAAKECSICKTPIGYETNYYRNEEGGLEHAACVWAREEQRQATMRAAG
jgi:hypothetical protein